MRDDADRRTRRARQSLDAALGPWGDFTPAQHLEGIIPLYSTCKRCGALILLTDGADVGEDASVVIHWQRHHWFRAFVVRHRLLDRLPKPVKIVVGLIIHYRQQRKS